MSLKECFGLSQPFYLRVQQKKKKTNMDLGKNKVIQLGFKFLVSAKLGLQTKLHNVNEGIDFSYK
jgi:hypothetical protein